MASKFKNMFKRQWSQPVRTTSEIFDSSGTVLGELHDIPEDYMRRTSRPTSAIIGEAHVESPPVVLRNGQNVARRHRTSLGPIEDILQCPICLERLKSPRMMPCQHTFCRQCLKNQLMTSSSSSSGNALKCPVCNLTVTDRLPDDLPTNIYVETLLRVIPNSGIDKNNTKKNATVTFAPLLVPKDDDENNSESGNCNLCSATKDICDRCDHCQQTFCRPCWRIHVNGFNEQMQHLGEQLVTIENRFAHKMKDFAHKVEELKEFIDKDVGRRIAELKQEREERIKKVDEMGVRGKNSAEDIKDRLRKTQSQLQKRSNGSSDPQLDDEEKVKSFVELEQKTAGLMAAVSAWDPELEDVEIEFENTKDRLELTKINEDTGLYYRRKAFDPRVVVNRDLVQRPSGLCHDPWRDQILVACPGSGQVVIFDRKLKPLRRIYHRDMMAPQGVAFLDDKDEILVTDKWKHCIFAFDRKGELVRRIGSKGQGDLNFRCPEGIAVHRHLVYVADTGNDRIQIIKKDGTFHGCIGLTEKNGPSVAKSGKMTTHVVVNHLNQPTDVAVSSTKIVVADCGNHKIKIFNHNGQIIRTIGGAGSLRDLFKSPEVVRIDRKGNVIVGDSGNGRIQIFSAEGEFLRMLGTKGGKNRQFGWVSGLLVKNNLDIFVADSKNNVVIQF